MCVCVYRKYFFYRFPCDISTVCIKVSCCLIVCHKIKIILRPPEEKFPFLNPSLFLSKTVNCPVGYFFESFSCQACAEDEYQDQEAQTSCISCPSSTSTFGQRGSKQRHDCQGNRPQLRILIDIKCLRVASLAYIRKAEIYLYLQRSILIHEVLSQAKQAI